MGCSQCDAILDVSEADGPYTVRSCEACGRRMKIRELGKHGIGIEIKKGDQFVIPANFITISANPLKSTGNLYRPGLAWFAELVFANEITSNREDFAPYLDKQLLELDEYLRKSEIFKGIDFDDA